jgi:hypothetical protein
MIERHRIVLQIREAFGFEGTPIWFKVRARNPDKK